MKTIDLNSWKRKEHFRHFSGLDDPYWSFTTELDCYQTYQAAKKNGESFFLRYLHKSLLAVQKVEELRMRIKDDQVVCYEEIHASATVLRDDETFGCCFIEFFESFSDFATNAKEKIKQTRAGSGMCLDNDYLLNQIHYSSIPWFNFSSLTFARSLKPQDSVPKMTFGRLNKETWRLPLAMQVHHGLVDGLHVARFLEVFQSLLNDTEVEL
ncbi:MAG: chloramphenicol O-acetyltransferase type [Clostridiales bacterium]|jgi:chloramphenicol O-acetyltransferase type A|nr:chloramphenicol O-acetyltransferase type [Clostridiales bacterium]MDN5283302.1 chloramphenicol O-acetyltransferase type [Candidatus Ozemobacter sp.]